MTNTEITEKLAEFMGYRYSDLLEAVFIDGQEPVPWNPLEKISDAWELVEKLRDKDYWFYMGVEGIEKNEYFAQFTNDFSSEYVVHKESSAPRAICMAVIKVMENG